MSNLGEQAMEILDELHTERLAYESEYVPLADAANLLTAYEETGLAPEDILSATDMAKVACALHELNKYKELGDLDRLRELVEADREGRCVVLPCKVGESLWIHDKDGKPREMILDEPDIRCHCKEEDNLCMVLCRAKHTGVCAMRLRNDGSSIGKTVFLTCEEAEDALEEMKNG